MLNRVLIMGRLGKDPELRRTQSGVSVTTFSIACDRDYKPENGERETDWITIVAWRNTAEFAAKYLSKGRMAIIDGRIQVRPWTDQNGNQRTAFEVVADSVYFGDSKNDRDEYAPNPAMQQKQMQYYPQPSLAQQVPLQMQAQPQQQYAQQSFGNQSHLQEIYGDEDDGDLPF